MIAAAMVEIAEIAQQILGNVMLYFLKKWLRDLNAPRLKRSENHASSVFRNASSSQTKEQKNDIPFLPKDIIFRILLCLLVEFLHYCEKFVCKAWAKIIYDPSFIKAHLLQSKDGFSSKNLERQDPSMFSALISYRNTPKALFHESI
ncbi:hypothetical protein LOK49_LG03G02580 [Camellia lanceoleosa]|uniref:Uncharacterized protein n=1 Tax=Camellia lanceoleosa TaxID=1840588 RepID=A0ACC0IAH4_9ERIC|nr:hypothetical protein LOK49_LG03G02580 [Camellia lanceoleosa]